MTPELGLILAVAGMAFFVKAIAGFGGPLLAIPLLAPTIGVEHSIVVLSFANLASNALMLWEHRSAASGSSRLLVPMLSAGALGTVIGTRFLTSLDDRWLSLAVASMVIAYVTRSVTAARLQLTPERGRSLVLPVGLVGGLVHGATGNSGPVFGTYLDALGLPRSKFVFNVSVPFLVLSTIQVTGLMLLGSFTPERTQQALITIGPVAIATLLGSLVGRRVPARLFRTIVLVMLSFAALRLVIAALS